MNASQWLQCAKRVFMIGAYSFIHFFRAMHWNWLGDICFGSQFMFLHSLIMQYAINISLHTFTRWIVLLSSIALHMEIRKTIWYSVDFFLAFITKHIFVVCLQLCSLSCAHSFPSVSVMYKLLLMYVNRFWLFVFISICYVDAFALICSRKRSKH